MDVFYEGIVTPVTGILTIDSIVAGEWEIFRNAVYHLILRHPFSGIIPRHIC